MFWHKALLALCVAVLFQGELIAHPLCQGLCSILIGSVLVSRSAYSLTISTAMSISVQSPLRRVALRSGLFLSAFKFPGFPPGFLESWPVTKVPFYAAEIPPFFF